MAKARSYLQLQNAYMLGQRSKARAAARRNTYKGGKLPKRPKKPATRNAKGNLKAYLKDPTTGAIYKRKPTKGFKKNGMPRAPPSYLQLQNQHMFAQRAAAGRLGGLSKKGAHAKYRKALPSIPLPMPISYASLDDSYMQNLGDENKKRARDELVGFTSNPRAKRAGGSLAY